MKKSYIIVVVLVLILVAFFFINRNKQVQAPAEQTDNTILNEETSVSVVDDTTAEAPAVREFTVSGKNFSFSPNTLTVKKGDKVKITFDNTEGFHDLNISEFNVATQKIQAGKKEIVEFTADKTGSFQYYCSVGSHRANGMWGTLKVE